MRVGLRKYIWPTAYWTIWFTSRPQAVLSTLLPEMTRLLFRPHQWCIYPTTTTAWTLGFSLEVVWVITSWPVHVQFNRNDWLEFAHISPSVMANSTWLLRVAENWELGKGVLFFCFRVVLAVSIYALTSLSVKCEVKQLIQSTNSLIYFGQLLD